MSSTEFHKGGGTVSLPPQPTPPSPEPSMPSLSVSKARGDKRVNGVFGGEGDGKFVYGGVNGEWGG